MKTRQRVLLESLSVDDIQAPKRWAINGGPFGSKLVQRDYVDSGVPVVRGVNLSGDGRFNCAGFVYVTEGKADELLSNNAHPGDLVFTQRGTVGQVGLIPKESPHRRYVISQSQMKLTVDEARAVPLFVYYYFRNPSTVKELENRAFSSGVPHINLAILRDFQVRLPSLHTQRKVSAILSAYDDLIENNNRRIKLLEEMARLIYREWFVNFRFPGHEYVDMVDSPAGRIPAGWAIRTLGDLAEATRDSIMPSQVEPETPYFGLEHLPRRSIALSAWGDVKDVTSTKLVFRKGDILFGKIRPYFHKVGAAPLDGVCSSDIIVIRPRQQDYFGLVLACTSSDTFVNHASQTSQGTKMPRANWEVLVRYSIPMPQGGLLSEFNRHMSESINLIHNLIFRNRGSVPGPRSPAAQADLRRSGCF